MSHIQTRSHQKPVVISSTAPPTLEHRKANRAGQIVLGAALACLVTSGVAAFQGFVAIAMTAAGVCVALLVVGLLLHYEGVRQRQRADTLRTSNGR